MGKRLALNLSGKALIAVKKKHHVGPLENKQQLIKALEKAAGEELAEKVKKEENLVNDKDPLPP